MTPHFGPMHLIKSCFRVSSIKYFAFLSLGSKIEEVSESVCWPDFRCFSEKQSEFVRAALRPLILHFCKHNFFFFRYNKNHYKPYVGQSDQDGIWLLWTSDFLSRIWCSHLFPFYPIDLKLHTASDHVPLSKTKPQKIRRGPFW